MEDSDGHWQRLFASVVTLTAQGTVVAPLRTMSWVNVVTTPSVSSSVSQRLSREFMLQDFRNQEDQRINGKKKNDAHGPEIKSKVNGNFRVIYFFPPKN